MIQLHREGISIIIGTTVFTIITLWLIHKYFPGFFWWVFAILFACLLILINFFRNPDRNIPKLDNQLIYAPADGRVVVIDTVMDSEYFNKNGNTSQQQLQVSIFMSPLNVHVNRIPVSGTIKYFAYHPGKYLFAWLPKSSTDNEHTTTVIQTGKYEILLRQIAGALARRICYYIQPGDQVKQGNELGFIKFGSRVDVLLPLNSTILVKKEQHVLGNQTIIAKLPD